MMGTPPLPTRSRWRIPDTFLIFLALALLAWGATFLFTPGHFQVAGDPARLVTGSFVTADGPVPAPLFGTEGTVGFLGILFEGLVSGTRSSSAVGLAAFLLVVGGSFGIVMATGTIDRAVVSSLRRAGSSGDLLLVGLFVGFSLAGAVFGMGEEAIALHLILVPALRRAGYDSLTGLLVCLVGTQVGFATSWMNPFSVMVAQSIAGLPPLSGLGFRVALWAGFTSLSALWVWRYARNVRLHPGRSMAFETDRHQPEPAAAQAAAPMRKGDWLMLVLLAAVLAWVGWGVVAAGWYLAELSAQFLALGLGAAILAGLFRLGPVGEHGRAATLAAAFRDGAAQMVPVVLIIGIVKGILIMLGGDDPTAVSLLNALLDALSGLVAGLPEWLTAGAMLLVQSVLNILIPSGSGQAAVTMPIMAPLADLAGVSRQVAVLAFQLGDGLTNLVAPTSAVLLGSLAAARVELDLWLRFFWKPMAALMLLALAAVLLAHAIGLQ